MKERLNHWLLKIKQHFCPHDSYEATYEENPAPTHLLKIEAKCSKCGKATAEILARAYENYYMQLGREALFQRNIDKFPEYYKLLLEHQRR